MRCPSIEGREEQQLLNEYRSPTPRKTAPGANLGVPTLRPMFCEYSWLLF